MHTRIPAYLQINSCDILAAGRVADRLAVCLLLTWILGSTRIEHRKRYLDDFGKVHCNTMTSLQWFNAAVTELS